MTAALVEQACLAVAALSVGNLFVFENAGEGSAPPAAVGESAALNSETGALAVRPRLRDPSEALPWQTFSNDVDAYLWACGAFCHCDDQYV